MPSDPFAAALQRRIQNYSRAEATVAGRLAELAEELDRLRERRRAAEMLYEAEFGEPVAPDASVGVMAPRALTESKHVVAGDQAVLIPPGAGAGEQAELVTAHVPGPLTGLPWAEAIERVMQDAGTPLHVKEVWERLVAGGFQTGSRDPLRSIVAISVRSERIVRTGPNTYGLPGAGPHQEPRDAQREEVGRAATRM